MTLFEAIRDLDSLDEESTIYAAEPWTADSQAIVMPQPDDGRLPDEARKLGFEYFLEVWIAREVLQDWVEWVESLNAKPTLQMKCARVIEYAVNDA